ncbi:hypothetical protein GCM10022205_25080 [Spinactinospora alkalitolerans]
MNTRNENDPRRGNVEGRSEVQCARTSPRIIGAAVEAQPCAACVREAAEAMANDPVARALAQWADGAVVYVTDCDHGPENRR